MWLFASEKFNIVKIKMVSRTIRFACETYSVHQFFKGSLHLLYPIFYHKED